MSAKRCQSSSAWNTPFALRFLAAIDSTTPPLDFKHAGICFGDTFFSTQWIEPTAAP